MLGYMTMVFGAQRGHSAWKIPGKPALEGFPFADVAWRS
jgi:hypothetical protein